MAHILTVAQRSVLMARIRSAGNASTELRLVALLRAAVRRVPRATALRYAAEISGWRRGVRLKCQVTGEKWQGAEGARQRPTQNEEGRGQKGGPEGRG